MTPTKHPRIGAGTACNTLHRAATRCNTLQHDTSRCNTLHHPTTRCSALSHSATRCNTLQHAATQRRTTCSAMMRWHSLTLTHGNSLLYKNQNTLQHSPASSTNTAQNNLGVQYQHNMSQETYIHALRAMTETPNVTLQHTATHCTTLQDAARRCNTLPQTVPHSTTLHHTADP